MQSNWDISYEKHLERFREVVPEEVFLRTNIKFDQKANHFVLNIFGYKLFASFPEFTLVPENAESCPKALYSFNIYILVMRVLYQGVYAPASETLKAYRELPWGELYDKNFNGRCIKRFAYGFGFSPDKYIKAAGQIGGVSASGGDIVYDFMFLGDVKCRFILWKPDDEFPPSAQILFSDNCILIYNAEDLAVVGDVIISTLKEMSR